MSPTISRNLPVALLPKAFSGLHALLTRAIGARDLDQLYAVAIDHPGGLIDGVLRHLRVRCRFDSADAAEVPQNGPVIVVANHPTGVFDGIVLAQALSQVRNDVKIVANEMVAVSPQIEEFIIPVDLAQQPASVSRNARSLRRCLEHIAAGGLLLVFPAGEVSRFRWRSARISDSEWNTSVARLIRAAARLRPELNIVPMHVDGRNSALFHTAGNLHQAVRRVLVARELTNKRGAVVTVRAGRAVRSARLISFESDRDAMQYLRWRTYLLKRRQDFKAVTSGPLRQRKRAVTPDPIAAPVPAAAMRREIEELPADRLLAESDGLQAYVANANEIPNVLTEIGGLREIAFRKAGEGTGRAIDLDRFDQHYLHLFLWHEAKAEIVGAYRLAQTDVVHDSQGIGGLYTATLFDYTEVFLRRMGPALELGRSWVRPEWQRSFAPLLLLWKAIGKFVSRHPQYKILFGPVSVSSTYQPASRELLVTYLERYAALREWTGLVTSRMPFAWRKNAPDVPRLQFGLEDLSTAISDIEPDGRGVPVLLRHYLKLGGRLLGFNIDPDFSNALDGLIVVDLTRTERKLLERYLGRKEAAEFLDFQKGTHAA